MARSGHAKPGLQVAFLATLFVAGTWLGLSTGPAVAHQSDPRKPGAAQSRVPHGKAGIKVNVRHLLLDVVVTDANNQPIKGLAEGDFTVFEDNVPQKILSFEAHSDSPTSLPPPAPVLPPNSFRNLPVADEAAPLNVLLYDVLNTPLSDQPYAHDQVVRFLRQRQRGGRMAIFVLSDKLHLLQGFTDDERQLLSAMNRKETEPQTSALNGTTVIPSPTERLANVGPYADDPTVRNIILRMQRVESAEANFFLIRREEETIKAFQEIAHFLSGLPGRKNLIWLSGSFPTPIFSGSNPFNPFGSTISYNSQLRDAANLLTVGQIAVYPVDARGLPGDGAYSGTVSGLRRTGPPDISLFSEHVVMEEIAHDTGGHAFYFTNGLADAMATSTADGSNYYTLSYSPSNTNFNGHMRKIRVKLLRNEHQAFRLSYRHSYLADDEAVLAQKLARAPEERLLNAAIRGAPLARDLAIEVQIHPQGAPAQVTPDLILHLAAYPAFASLENWNGVQTQSYEVDYTIRAGHISFNRSSDGTHQGKFEFQFAAYDSENRAVFGQWTRAENLYSAEQVNKLASGRFQFQQVIQVPTVSAWLRLVVRDVIGDHIGSVEIPLPLPPDGGPGNNLQGSTK